MAALTATDWTTVVEDTQIGHKKRISRCKLTLATIGEYGSGGIPIPVFGKLGHRVRTDYVLLIDELSAFNQYVIRYDKANSKIRVYSATASTGANLNEIATTVIPGAATPFVIWVEAVGW